MPAILIGQDKRLHAVYVRNPDPLRPEMAGMLFVPVEVRGDVLSGYGWSAARSKMFGPVRIEGKVLSAQWTRDNQQTELLRMSADAKSIDLSKLGQLV
jgi:hypothetical protein